VDLLASGAMLLSTPEFTVEVTMHRAEERAQGKCGRMGCTFEGAGLATEHPAPTNSHRHAHKHTHMHAQKAQRASHLLALLLGACNGCAPREQEAAEWRNTGAGPNHDEGGSKVLGVLEVSRPGCGCCMGASCSMRHWAGSNA